MGLFHSLLGRHKATEKDEPSHSTPSQQEPPQTSSSSQELQGIYQGMPVTVVDEDDSLFFSAMITTFSSTGLTIEPKAGDDPLPVLRKGTDVTIRGYRKNTSSIDIGAVVQESSAMTLRVKDPTLITHEEKRHFFRLPLNIPGEIYAPNDRMLAHAQACTVINISCGGVGVLLNVAPEQGEYLRLRVRLIRNTPVHMFTCVVMRVIPRTNGTFECGMQFLSMDEQKTSALLNSMFTVQRAMRREQEDEQNS